MNFGELICKMGVHQWEFSCAGVIILKDDNTDLIFTEDFICIQCGKRKRNKYYRCWESEETDYKRYHASICNECGRVFAGRSWFIGEGGYYCGQGDGKVVGDVIKNCECGRVTDEELALRGELFGL